MVLRSYWKHDTRTWLNAKTDEGWMAYVRGEGWKPYPWGHEIDYGETSDWWIATEAEALEIIKALGGSEADMLPAG